MTATTDHRVLVMVYWLVLENVDDRLFGFGSFGLLKDHLEPDLGKWMSTV